MRFVHWVASHLYRPRVLFADGAKEAINNHLKQNKQILLAGNHVLGHDPLVLASMLKREKVFAPMMTRTVIPGKAPLFNLPVVGWIVSNGGAIPTFRAKDIKANHHEGESLEARRLRAGARVVNIAIAKLNQGLHVAVLPEGTRNRGDSTRIMALKEGIGRIACGAANSDTINIVCAGIHYGENKDNIHRPAVVVGYPLDIAGTPSDVVHSVSQNLQDCVDRATKISG